jgi:uncharacterized protein YkwD
MPTETTIARDLQREQAFIAEINHLRRNPTAYVPIVEAYAQRSPAIDLAATREIVWFLQSATPVESLTATPGLTRVAQLRGAAASLNPLSHDLKRYGKVSGTVVENYADNCLSCQEAIAQWLISQRDRRRQSRRNLLEARWRNIGTYSGENGQYWAILTESYLDFAEAANHETSVLDRAIFSAVNQLRTAPQSYIPVLQAWRSQFIDQVRVKREDDSIYCSKEGIHAVDEAIAVLAQTEPLAALSLSEGMSHAARDLVREQSQTGEVGSIGRDRHGPSDRLARYGTWQDRWAESLSYGQPSARDVIRDLLINDGNRDRRDRAYLLDPQFQVVGIAGGYHPRYDSMAAILFAAGYRDAI